MKMDFIKGILNVSKMDPSDPVIIENVTHDSGIHIFDEKGVKAAKSVGWIIAYKNLEQYLNHEDFEIDLARFDAIDTKLTRFAMRLVRNDAERKNQKLPDLNEKENVTKMIMTKIFGSSYEYEPILVLRLKRENKFRGTSAAKIKIENLQKNKKVSPAYVTSGAISKLFRIIDDPLQLDQDAEALKFETTTTAQSTGLDQFGPDFGDLELNLSVIASDQSFLREDLQSIRDKSLLGLGDETAIDEIEEKLNQTMTTTAELQILLENKTQNTNEAHLQVREHCIMQKLKIEALEKTLKDEGKELELKNAKIKGLERDQETLKFEYDGQIASLENEIEKISELLEKSNKQKLESIPLAESQQLEEENLALLEKKKELEKQIRFQKLKMKNIKSEADLQKKEKEKLENNVKDLKTKLEATKSDLDVKVANNKDLERKINDLNVTVAKLGTISARNRQLSTESEKASEIISSFGSPKRPKLIRQSKIETSNVTDLFPSTEVMQTTLATISSKDVTSVLPKYTAGHSTPDYVSKIKKAWAYCNAEEFDEGKFCQLLMTQLPNKFDSIVDELDEGDKAKVETVCDKIMQLDRQKSSYLADYARCSKLTSETYNEYALRIKKLYLRGTGNTKLNSGENLALCEAFLNGLPSSESTALRLCANEEELGNVLLLAKRASRSRPNTTKNNEINELRNVIKETKDSLNEIKETKKAYPDRQEISSKPTRRNGSCHFCKRYGHFWRECRRRASVKPNWRPHFQTYKKKEEKKEDSK